MPIDVDGEELTDPLLAPLQETTLMLEGIVVVLQFREDVGQPEGHIVDENREGLINVLQFTFN